MKKLSAILPAVAMVASAGFSVAQEEVESPISGNIGVTSNYVFRGVTQNDDSAAVQGGLDYGHESGLYVGTWVSNVDFGGPDGGGAEVDVYAGFAGESGDIAYDIGVLGYFYPNYDDSNFGEIYASVGYDMFTIGGAYTFASEVSDGYFDTGDYFFYGSAGFDVAEDLAIGLTIGYYGFDFSDDGNYVYGQVDITKSAGDYGDFTFSVSLADESDIASDDLLVFVSWGTGF